MSGRYASYWNAFLFLKVGVVNKNISVDRTTHQTQLSVCLYNPYFKQVDSKTFFVKFGESRVLPPTIFSHFQYLIWI